MKIKVEINKKFHKITYNLNKLLKCANVNI